MKPLRLIGLAAELDAMPVLCRGNVVTLEGAADLVPQKMLGHA
jgi:hypothetical protein